MGSRLPHTEPLSIDKSKGHLSNLTSLTLPSLVVSLATFLALFPPIALAFREKLQLLRRVPSIFL